MIARRTILGGLAAGTALGLAPGLSRSARAADRPYRIAMILWRGWEDASQGFKDYFDEHRIAIELSIHDAQQTVARLPAIVEKVRAEKPDLIYLWGTTTALEVLGPVATPDPARHITDIPAVFNIVTEPVAGGLIRSLEAPGRNATGTLYVAPLDIQLRSLKAFRPVTSMGVVFNPHERNSVLTVGLLRDALAGEGIALVEKPIPADAQGAPIAAAIPGLVKEVKDAAEWLYIPPDTFLNVNRALLTDSAVQVGLPCFTSSEGYIRDGKALLGVVSRYYSVGQFTAFKAAQILTENKQPAEIPVEALNRFSLMINMQVARALGVYPPLQMLRYAEIV